MRRIVSVLVLGALAFACASESLNPQPLPPSDEKSPSAGAATNGCSGTCCEKPPPGTACDDAGAGTTCTWAVTCATGLVLPYEVKCENGTWQAVVECPKDGEDDARGCPSRQPANDSPCELSEAGANGQCGYVLDCKSYRESEISTCSGGKWQSTPLAPCN